MRRRQTNHLPEEHSKGVHIFINSEDHITIGQTLADDTETHVSLSAKETALLLGKLPQMLRELEARKGN